MWNRSCRNAFNTLKLDRMVKRKMPLVIHQQQTDMLNFFFCWHGEEDMKMLARVADAEENGH